MLRIAAAGAGPVRADEAAAGAPASLAAVQKLLTRLTAAGLLVSYKGPSGGYELSRAGADATPLDVIAAIDPAWPDTACVLGPDHCTAARPCPMRRFIGRTLKRLARGLSRMRFGESLRG